MSLANFMKHQYPLLILVMSDSLSNQKSHTEKKMNKAKSAKMRILALLEYRQTVLLYKYNNFYKNKKIYSLELFNHLLKLSAVRKVLETRLFLALGSFETLGSKLSHGTSWIAEIIHWIISPNVRTHLRKVSKKILSLIKKTGWLRSFL